ncbi:Terminal nucleotidyltransferase 5C [Schistosoma japonicum]|nr:Terminal nucleotidyltransferase 5C [Schistosoma japonicum]
MIMRINNNRLQSMNEHFYPIVVVESVAGSYFDALSHLNECIIVTKQPEEIYGGGLLNYCKLLVFNYKPSEKLDIVSMEKYMCSRFFIDFPDIMNQYHQLNNFLLIHFKQNQLKLKEDYLNVSDIDTI